MNTQLNEIAQKVKEIVNHEYLYFDDPLTVKLTPHSHPVRLWGACVSPKGDVYVMDQEQTWHKVEANERTIIASLWQRVSSISLNYSKAV